MAHRFFLALSLSLVSFAALSSSSFIPWEYSANGFEGPWYKSFGAACASRSGHLRSNAAGVQSCMRSALEHDPVEYPIFTRATACPVNSTSGAQSACTCDPGFKHVDGECVPDEADDPVCGSLAGMSMGVSSVESDFGKQSTSWAASNLGKSGNACIQGCQVSGTISGCVSGGSMVCMVNSPAFTGASCGNDADGGSGGSEGGSSGGEDDGCPPDTILQPVSGLCVPKQTSCPDGQEPSKYVEGICIPKEASNDGKCEDPKDPTKRVDCQGSETKCPSGKVPSKVTPNVCVSPVDGAEKSQNGNTYVCEGGKCTVTKGNCTPTAEDDCKEEKSQGDACKEAPDLKQCSKESGITGSCAGAFQCKGDALQCAIAVEQHKRNCELFEKENDYSKLFTNARNSQNEDGSITGTEVDLAGHFKVDSVIGNGQCPSDLTVMVMDRPVTLRLSEFCEYFNAMGYLLFLGACIRCLLILGA